MDSGTSPTECRVILIGSNPSIKSTVNSAFDSSTKSGVTLKSWLEGIEIAYTYYANVSNSSTPGNRPLTKTEIRKNLPHLKETIDWHNEMNFAPIKVVAVGTTAAKALKMLNVEFYELPHPSGLNRQLNDPKFVAEKIKGLVNFLQTPSDESN